MTAARFRTAVEAGDAAAAAALFATDAAFHSPGRPPALPGTRRDLRDPARRAPGVRGLVLPAPGLLRRPFHPLHRYTGEYGGPDGHVLRFTARVGDRDLEGVDILEERDGELVALTVLVRPHSAATALRERMAALLT